MQVIKLDGVEEGDWTEQVHDRSNHLALFTFHAYQLFEDLETKAFYEDLIDLNIIIPKKLLEGNRSNSADGSQQDNGANNEETEKIAADNKAGERNIEEEKNEDGDLDDFDPDKMLKENQGNSEEIDELAKIGEENTADPEEKNPELKHHPFDMLLQATATARTTKQIDDVATTFCQKFNTKASQHRLIRQVMLMCYG